MVVRFRSVLLAFLVLAVAQPALAGPSSKLHKLDLALREAVTKAPQPQQVIIRTKAGCRPALRRALVTHGDVIEAEHPTFDALTAFAHGEDLEALANDPCVVTVSSNAVVSSNGAPGQSAGAAAAAKLRKVLRLWRGGKPGLPDAGKPSAQSEVRALLGLADDPAGDGITVAILDSGLEMSEDFDSDRVEFWDFTRGGFRTRPYDDYGHGTHIAGLIASAPKQHPEYGGVAPAVHLKIFKVLDKHGRGRTSQVLRAMEYIIANRDLLGVDVINLSLGHPVFESATTDPLVRAVELAVRRGITVVVSAGNNGSNPLTREIGYAGINSPGNAPSAITAGAASTQHTVPRNDDEVAFFSSRGPTWYDGFAKPDVVAPGVALVSNVARRGTLVRDNPSVLVDSRYARLSGSSMASAVTTGLVAALMSADHNRPTRQTQDGTDLGLRYLRPNAYKAILQYTATPLLDPLDPDGEAYDLLTQGAGEINGLGALELVGAIDTMGPDGDPRAFGEQWVDAPDELTHATAFGGVSEAWFDNIVWGTYLARPLDVPYDSAVDPMLVNSRAWDNIVWGTAFYTRDDGDNIVWGTVYAWDDGTWVLVSLQGDDNIVWGTVGRSEDDNIVWGSSFKEDWADNIVWGTSFLGIDRGDNIVWGTEGGDGGDNIVWGSLTRDNIVWGNLARGTDNIVWGSYRDFDDNIVWGNSRGGDNIVWGTGRNDDDNIVWGTSASPKKASKTTGGAR